MTLTWSDQPPWLEDATHACGFYIKDKGIVEVRKMVRQSAVNGKTLNLYYVSVGNLFKSETVECEGADAAFAVIDLIQKQERPITLPTGCIVVEA